MKRFKEKYPNDVELIIVEKLPIDEYLKKLYNANIVIDQIFADTLGMNSLFTMATGRVVFSNYKAHYYNKNIPAISIDYKVNDILNKLEFFLENKHNIPEIGHKSRLYVEENHNYIKISNEFVQVWGI